MYTKQQQIKPHSKGKLLEVPIYFRTLRVQREWPGTGTEIGIQLRGGQSMNRLFLLENLNCHLFSIIKISKNKNIQYNCFLTLFEI